MSSAVDECERAIRRSILAGELRPGDRLPPERALAERFGVNRTTLRAALGRLASARLLTVRQGSGYLVHDYRKVAGLELIPELASLALERGEGLVAIVADVLEVRRRLATMVLERVATAANADAVNRVEAAVSSFARTVEEGASTEAIADADLEVTAAVLDATGSPVLGLCLNPVSLVVHELAPLREAIYAEPETNVAAYRVLVAWMRAPSLDAVPLVASELERRDRVTLTKIAAL